MSSMMFLKVNYWRPDWVESISNLNPKPNVSNFNLKLKKKLIKKYFSSTSFKNLKFTHNFISNVLHYVILLLTNFMLKSCMWLSSTVVTQHPQFPIHAKHFNEEKNEWMNILKYNVLNSYNDKDFLEMLSIEINERTNNIWWKTLRYCHTISPFKRQRFPVTFSSAH